jgi:hypothetical protein
MGERVVVYSEKAARANLAESKELIRLMEKVREPLTADD